MTTAVCAVGPVLISRLSGAAADPEQARAVLDDGDGRFVLVGDRPVPIHQAWRHVLRPLLGGADRVLLVHPSWWPAPRINVVRAVAGELAGGLQMCTRANVWARRAPAAVVVEIAPHAVVVTADGSPITLRERSTKPAVLVSDIVDAVRAAGPTRPVILDVAAGVPGGDVLAEAIGAALAETRLRVRVAPEHEFIAAATAFAEPAETLDEVTPVPRRWRRPALLTAGLVAALAVVVLLVRLGPQPDQGGVAAPVTALVEGRATMQIPADWVVRRVTEGPGSARVQVVSPLDGNAVLHLTQSRIANSDLAATAAVLRRAVDGEPPDVFVDFNPAGTRAGRPAVTYRETRPGRDIEWTVLVDGDLRISIGCQSGRGHPEVVAGPCADAVRTARRLP
ncbi:type VII secretion-associated protein [Mycolicibacterium mengxianglii]|uniref:type VII secretion-associated protein n=1 Tax=Mycolicibacterium mengxianglii TaxID=2736649 RepID=UPI0018EEEC88|nr:type VII secretion-associated protein [Mycolicibacterium mengxianglii]